MVDYKIHWLKMMSVPESRAVVGRHDGINGRDRQNFTERFSRTLELLVEKAGAPLPYDAVLPARVNQECCFGRVVTLDQKRVGEIEKLVRTALFNRPCVPKSVEPTAWMEFMSGFTS